MGRGNFEREKGRPIVKYRDTLRSSVQKRLNIEMPFGLWSVDSVSRRKHAFSGIRQLAPKHKFSRIRSVGPMNRPSAAAMQPYVKLIWPLVMVALWNRADHYICILWCFFLPMAALCNRAGHYIFALWFVSSIYLSIFFFPSPNLSGRMLDVYHTLTHGVALVRI